MRSTRYGQYSTHSTNWLLMGGKYQTGLGIVMRMGGSCSDYAKDKPDRGNSLLIAPGVYPVNISYQEVLQD